MQEAFTIRKAIVSLFEDYNVEDSFFDLFFFSNFQRRLSEHSAPSGRASSFEKLDIHLLQGSPKCNTVQ